MKKDFTKIWHSVLKILKISKKDYKKVASFLENISQCDSPYGTLTEYREPGLHKLLPINIKILSKIKDLSKIEFLDRPFYFKRDKQIGVEIQKNLIFTKRRDSESMVIDTIVEMINKKIEKGFGVWIYMPIETLNIGNSITYFSSRMCFVGIPYKNKRYKLSK